MANVEQIKAIIDANVYENHNNEVTANGVKAAMYALADAIGEASEVRAQFVNVEEDGLFVVDQDWKIGFQVTPNGMSGFLDEISKRYATHHPREYEKGTPSSWSLVGTYDNSTGDGNQGGINVRNFFFQFYNRNAVIDVFDLDTLATIATIPTNDGDVNVHCNNVSLGDYLYVGDNFPLFYVSAQDLAEVRVYHISNEFVCSKIQTITLSGISAANGFVDFARRKIIWTYGPDDCWESELPPLSSSTVTVDPLERFSVPGSLFVYGFQDTIADSGFILVAFGIPSSSLTPQLQLLDILRKEVVWTYAMPTLPDEPEGIAYYNGAIYITTATYKVYKFVWA